MSQVPDAAVDQLVTERALSMARRLAHGSGRATVQAFRESPQQSFDVLAHGLSSTGELVVAVHASNDQSVTMLAPGVDFEVRVDLHKESLEPALRIVAASMHLLGSLLWLTDQAIDPLCARRDLPGSVDAVRHLSGVRVGVVRADRAVLHDSMGVSPFCWTHLAEPAPTDRLIALDWSSEWDAHERVAAVGQHELLAIHDAVIDERLPGKVCGADFRRAGLGEGTTVHCVDVDPAGLTLMAAGPEGTVTTFAAFGSPLARLDDLAPRLDELVRAS